MAGTAASTTGEVGALLMVQKFASGWSTAEDINDGISIARTNILSYSVRQIEAMADRTMPPGSTGTSGWSKDSTFTLVVRQKNGKTTIFSAKI